MPVLLLARGDQESKALLRNAIEARYGLLPPAIETLKLELKGRTRLKLGPVTTWVPLEGIAYFKLPFSVRWDFSVRPAGVALSSGSYAFDGAVAGWRRGERITTINDAKSVAGERARLWMISAMLLTPLAEQFVEMRAIGEQSLDAIHTEANLTARLQLNEDHTLNFAATDCVNPGTGMQQTYSVRLTEGQQMVGELMLPHKLGFFWDDQPEMELHPTAAENNPAVSDD